MPAAANTLLDSNRLSQVTREVNVETLENSEPVGNQLQWDDIEDTLENINRLGDLDLLGLVLAKLLVAFVADNNGLASTSSNWKCEVSMRNMNGS